MGKTELIIILIAVAFVSVLFILYFSNSKKINANKAKSDAKGDVKGDSAQKTEKPLTKSEQKELEKAQEEVKSNIKDIMTNVSIQSENYIKSLNMQDSQSSNANQVNFEEVSAEELMRDEAAEEAAIILGVKKKSVHVFDDEPTTNIDYANNYVNEDSDYSDHETSSAILHDMDSAEDATISKASSEIKLENFEEDDSVAEEFKDLSNRMKVMMVTDVFKRKFEDNNNENRED